MKINCHLEVDAGVFAHVTVRVAVLGTEDCGMSKAGQHFLVYGMPDPRERQKPSRANLVRSRTLASCLRQWRSLLRAEAIEQGRRLVQSTQV